MVAAATLPVSSMHTFAASAAGSSTFLKRSMFGTSPDSFLTAFGGTITGATAVFGGAAGAGVGVTGAATFCFGAAGGGVGPGAGFAGAGAGAGAVVGAGAV